MDLYLPEFMSGDIGYGIVFYPPRFFCKHFSKFCKVSRLIDQFRPKLQTIVNTCFPEIKELIIRLKSDQIYIEVTPGENGCYFYLKVNELRGESGTHNIDTGRQCLALYFALVAFLELAYPLAELLERDEVSEEIFDLDGSPIEIIIKPEERLKSYKFWDVKDGDLQTVGCVVARTRDDALKCAEEEFECFDVWSKTDTAAMPIKSYSKYVVRVTLADGMDDSTPLDYCVIARNNEEAESLVEKHFEKESLFDISSIEVVDVEPVKSRVLSTAYEIR